MHNHAAKSRTSRRVQLGFENLETRAMLAGNVKAAVVGGTLILTGDNSANQVQVSQSGNSWKVQGLGTKINGSTSIKTFKNVQNINAFLLKGDDFIKIYNGTLPGQILVSDSDDPIGIKSNDVVQISNIQTDNLIIDANDGADSVLVNKVNSNSRIFIFTSFSSRDLADSVTVLNSSVADDFVVGTGPGSDSVAVNGLTVSIGGAQIDTAAGNDSVSLANLSLPMGAVNVVTGDGADTLAITNISADLIAFNLDSGNDVATISQATVRSVFFSAGDGTDAVTFTRVAAAGIISGNVNAGNNDQLTLVQCTAADASFDGGGSPGATLVLSQDTFGSLNQSGFQFVVVA